MKKEITLTQVAKKAKDNHIWLNAFSCIRPTDEFKIDLANTILAKLNEPDCLLKTNTLSEMLYLSINKS